MESCDAFIDQVIADHGQVDILINNAGRSIRRAVEHSYERFHDFQRTMQLNYFGCLRLALRVLPGVSERKSAHIINISSMGVVGPPARFSAYIASKSALEAGPDVRRPSSATAISTSPISTCRWCVPR